MNKRFLEVLGLLLIGDGVLTLLDPERHCLLWEVGPEPWRATLDAFAKHPTASRVAGVAEVAAGIFLAQQQQPGWIKRLRHLE